MHPSITKLLIPLSGNTLIQSLIERILFSQFLNQLIGIGAGSSASESGEKIIFKLLKKQHSKSMDSLCVFDVGANQGQFLSIAQDNLKDLQVEIHSFEPSQNTYQILSESAKSYKNVILNNTALGKNIGQTELFYEQDGSWLASLTKRRLDHFGIDFNRSEIIKINTLDNYCSTHNIQQIDLLKLDVEGHELDVLQGASEMLKKQRIKMISFEFGSCNIDSRIFFQDLYYFLESHKMNSIFRITPSGYLREITEYREVYEQFLTTNFIALPQKYD
jgi:FkbM family methyltransferase